MQPFRYHVVMCTQQKVENVPCCAAAGAAAAVNALREELSKQGLVDEVLVSTTGCLGACEHGPVMIVYPDAIWYGKATAAEMPEIVRSHLGQGKPVERLRITDMPGLRQEILEHRRQYLAMVRAQEASGVLPETFMELVNGFQTSRTTLTAVELDLFTAVGSGAGAREVAAKLKTNPRATEMLLNAVASLGLLEKRDEIFFNTPMTARFLVESSPDNSRPGIMHFVHLWPRWSTLTEAVQEGKAVHPREREAPFNRAFIAAMDRVGKAQVPPTVAAIPAKGARRMLDLGGGSGAYSIAMAQAHPELQVDVFDLPAVVPLTQEYIRQAGLEARVRTRVGNLLSDDFGENYDLILLSAISHSFTPEQNRDFFRRAYAALAPGGRFIVREFILESDKTSPRSAALFSLNMLVGTEGGASHSEAEYEEWLRDSGFPEVRRVRLPGPSNLMIATRR
jgi:(2Fe-2S) ferredoxin/predicted O-methyltransferase YrrM